MKSIVYSVLIAFVFSFSIFFLLNGFTPDPTPSVNQNPFWNENFSEFEKTIFLFGSSHVGQINATYVQQKIDTLSHKSKIINLAYNSDNPSIRLDTIVKTISLNPTLVIYGISYLDLANSPEEEYTLPQLEELYIEFVVKENEFFDIKNPKWNTLNVIRIVATVLGMDIDSREILTLDNTPFYTYQKAQTVIASNSELIGQAETFPLDFTISIDSDNQKTKDLKKIITMLKENNVEIILFITPIFETYYESLNVESKKQFHQKMSDISNEFDVSLIDLSTQYSTKEIWTDPAHVALNKKSIIYSEDISKIIQEALK